MSSIITAAARRRSYLLASSFLVPISLLGISAAHAQQSAPPDQLPPIEVNRPNREPDRAKPSSE
jgi:vitamin B12 transporter